MNFHQRNVSYSPADLCWLRVTLHWDGGNKLTVTDENSSQSVEICDGSVHQLDEFIALLKHMRSMYFGKPDV
jgi:hypothetical protein